MNLTQMLEQASERVKMICDRILGECPTMPRNEIVHVAKTIALFNVACEYMEGSLNKQGKTLTENGMLIIRKEVESYMAGVKA